MASGDTITFETKNGDLVVIKDEAKQISPLVKDLIEDMGKTDDIRIKIEEKDCHKHLEFIFNGLYRSYGLETEIKYIKKDDKDVVDIDKNCEFYKSFKEIYSSGLPSSDEAEEKIRCGKVSDIINLINLSNYLKIEPLIRMCAMVIADNLKGRTSEEMKQIMSKTE